MSYSKIRIPTSWDELDWADSKKLSINHFVCCYVALFEKVYFRRATTVPSLFLSQLTEGTISNTFVIEYYRLINSLITDLVEYPRYVARDLRGQTDNHLDFYIRFLLATHGVRPPVRMAGTSYEEYLFAWLKELKRFICKLTCSCWIPSMITPSASNVFEKGKEHYTKFYYDNLNNNPDGESSYNSIKDLFEKSEQEQYTYDDYVVGEFDRKQLEIYFKCRNLGVFDRNREDEIVLDYISEGIDARQKTKVRVLNSTDFNFKLLYFCSNEYDEGPGIYIKKEEDPNPEGWWDTHEFFYGFYGFGLANTSTEEVNMPEQIFKANSVTNFDLAPNFKMDIPQILSGKKVVDYELELVPFDYRFDFNCEGGFDFI